MTAVSYSELESNLNHLNQGILVLYNLCLLNMEMCMKNVVGIKHFCHLNIHTFFMKGSRPT